MAGVEHSHVGMLCGSVIVCPSIRSFYFFSVLSNVSGSLAEPCWVSVVWLMAVYCVPLVVRPVPAYVVSRCGRACVGSLVLRGASVS